jgi:type I restriction enzyme S subunit
MYPYVRVANVKRDRLELTDVLQMPFSPAELALYTLSPGDIVLSEGQSPELVGQSGIYRGGYENLCIQATVHRFRAFTGLCSEYAQLVFLNHLIAGTFMRASSLTTNIAHLTSERLRPLPFPLAPSAEQIELVRRSRTALDGAGTLSQRVRVASQSCAQLDQSTLTKAFRGELVDQDPNDEPASVMLSRLAAGQHAAQETPTTPKRGPRQKARS